MAVNKRALLIGINSYPLLAARYQLNGCVNDLQLMESILRENFGFPQDNVSVLKDGQATRDGILGALDSLVGAAGEDDVVVVYYSGHGSQRTSPGGDGDEMDETIVPTDSGRRDPHPNRDIADKEIYRRLLVLSQKTPNTTFIFDSCHSGTITRDLRETEADSRSRARWVEPDDRPFEAEEEPPSPVELPAAEVARGGAREIGPSGWFPIGERYVLIAGCMDAESSYEHRVRSAGDGSTLFHGALTFFLAEELSKAQEGVTYRDVFEPASAKVTAVFPRQHPQMEGARHRELFGTRDIHPMRFVPVVMRAGATVTLGAGAAQGMTAGSRWAVYPQGTQQVTPQTPRLGTVEITKVRAVNAEAQIGEEAQPNAIAQGCRAVEEEHNFGEMRLVVSIRAGDGDQSATNELRALVARSDMLRVAADDEPADARVYIVGPRTSAELNDPVPQLGAVAEPTWAVVGEDGLLLMPTRPVGEAGAAAIVVQNLETEARYRQTRAIKNPNPDSRLRDKVELTLMRQNAQGDWVDAEPEAAGGYVSYEAGRLVGDEVSGGESIAFKITNRYSAPIFVSVLDFGLTKSVDLLYPVAAGANEQIAPGVSVQVGVREGEELRLYIPPGFPYAPDPGDDQGQDVGLETYKLFATTSPADFSFLTQAGVRSLTEEVVMSPFEALIDRALNGIGTRNTLPSRVPPDAEWTTVERAFMVRRSEL